MEDVQRRPILCVLGNRALFDKIDFFYRARGTLGDRSAYPPRHAEVVNPNAWSLHLLPRACVAFLRVPRFPPTFRKHTGKVDRSLSVARRCALRLAGNMSLRLSITQSVVKATQ